MAEEKWYGYVGAIAKIDVGTGAVERLDTMDYAPEFMGGKMLCHKLFWDDVAAGVGAFDPENELIFTTGPITGTGIPSSGRSTMGGISPNSLPEMYSTGSCGGWIGAVLKFAGFDGFILKGRAAEPSYVLIDNGNIEILPAEDMWGLRIHDAQAWLKERHGQDVQSLVIGPAGENLCRNASITTSGDNAFAKSGFGAVMGSKNLKGVAIKGDGVIIPADVEKVFELRQTVGHPHKDPNPITPREMIPSLMGFEQDFSGGYYQAAQTCSYGCTFRCNKLEMNHRSPFSEEPVNQVEKCFSNFAWGLDYDMDFTVAAYIHSPLSSFCDADALSYPAHMGEILDPNDPDLGYLWSGRKGSNVNYWDRNFARGCLMEHLCNEYGVDKFDMTCWLFTWISACQQEGLLDDLDFGMEPDVNDPAFIEHMMHILVYREGIGDLFAEGMARAIRTLGKEKYGDTIYRNYFNCDGEPRETPVSLEAGWGHPVHWQGRGLMGCPTWYSKTTSLVLTLNSRDCIGAGHPHPLTGDAQRYDDNDPAHTDELAALAAQTVRQSDIKDSVGSCEWVSPDTNNPAMEAEMFTAATGLPMTAEGMQEMARKSNLMFRAIQMRNFGRDRDLEVVQEFPIQQYPDSYGHTTSWEEWNDLVSALYREQGYDVPTGWPTRSTWERHGLGEVADTMETLGKLPPEGRSEFTPGPNPFAHA